MNLFKICSLNYEEHFSRRNADGRFIPLSTIKTPADIKKCVDSICELLIRNFKKADTIIPALEWSVNEIVDNIRNHSETVTPGIVVAQYYPKIYELHVFVGDNGRGIRNSLSESYELEDDKSAIKKAIQKGVTRNTNVGQGNGLAGTTEIIKLNRGAWSIITGNACLTINNDDEQYLELESSVKGTLVGLCFKVNNPVKLDDTSMLSDSGFCYIDYEANRYKDLGVIIKDECAWTGGREPARGLRNKLLAINKQYPTESIKLDFLDAGCSSSFLDELISKLVIEVGGWSTFKERFHIVNINQLNRGLLINVLKQRGILE